MTCIAPHTLPPHWPEIGAGRFAASIEHDNPAGCRVALLGVPDDTGVALNRGRVGAADGPTALRRALAKYGTSYDAGRERDLAVRVFDAGDVEPRVDNDATIALQETHHRVTKAAAALHERGLIVLGIGGGHDLTFPMVRALSQHEGKAVGGMNLDPHLDVRDALGSGMPFRSLIESGFVDAHRFTELGTGRFCNTQSHVEYLLEAGGQIVIDKELLQNETECVDAAFARAKGHDGTGSMFVSIDLDCLRAGNAPGVSALNPNGLDVGVAQRLAERAGRESAVKHFDIMELSPPNDIEGRTARIAALLMMHFLTGVEARP